jgi:small subunit ribosomal protein S25e
MDGSIGWMDAWDAWMERTIANHVSLIIQAKKDVAAKPSSSSGGKKAKKKWSAKKVKDKANNMVVLDKPTYERLFKEVPTYKLISQSVLVDRLKLNGSLARVALKELTAQGLIKPLTIHHAQVIYSKSCTTTKKQHTHSFFL